FDTLPYRKSADGHGAPEERGAAPFGFGLLAGDEDMDEALAESRALLGILQRMGIRWVCTTAGSPYYNPHVQRPAMFPPVDGYEPPEDPLHGVARQIRATACLKRDFPELVFVGSAYSYLQEWLPHIAQHAVANGMTDLVGLGRIVLSYPELPADVLRGAPLQRSRLCRTFSDCTTGPRMGLVSGCYPLDRFSVKRPAAARVRALRTPVRAWGGFDVKVERVPARPVRCCHRDVGDVGLVHAVAAVGAARQGRLHRAARRDGGEGGA